jgi:hypothetical protein
VIRFRIAEFVPESGFGTAYSDNHMATPKDNLSIIVPDESDVANIVDFFGNETNVEIDVEPLDTDDFVISNRSVVSREIRRPISLYYTYTIGRGSYDFYSKDAEAATTDQQIIDAIRGRITILDQNNNPAPGVRWDIEYTHKTTNRFEVRLLLERRCSHSVTYKVRYPGITVAGTTIHNQIEIINATRLVPETDYVTTYFPGTGYMLSMIGSGEMAPALALYGDNVWYQVQTDRIVFIDGGPARSVYTQTPTTGVISVQDLVADINALDVNVFATPLSDHYETGPLLVQGVNATSPEGKVVNFDGVAKVKYNEERRIWADLPRAGDTRVRWHPTINVGSYATRYNTRSYQYSVQDYKYQPFSYTHGFPYRDMLNEEPDRLGRRMVQLSRKPLHSTGCMLCYQNGTSTAFSQLVEDVDVQNSIVYLRNDHSEDTTLSFSYSYREDFLEYPHLDLNPVDNPGLHGKFVGIYMIPYYLETGSSTYQFERTIYHMISDTYQGIITALAGLELSDGTDVHPVLIGVYHIIQKETKDGLSIIDARVKGGGLKEDVAPKDTQEPEAEMFWNLSKWGGEPVQDRGTIIVEYPEEIIGTESRYQLVPTSMGLDHATGWLQPIDFYAEDDVLAAATKHTKAGALPILDQYNMSGVYYPTGFIVSDPTTPGAEWS